MENKEKINELKAYKYEVERELTFLEIEEKTYRRLVLVDKRYENELGVIQRRKQLFETKLAVINEKMEELENDKIDKKKK